MLSRAVFVHVPESDAAMSAPPVCVYTEQRSREKREQGQGGRETRKQMVPVRPGPRICFCVFTMPKSSFLLYQPIFNCLRIHFEK